MNINRKNLFWAIPLIFAGIVWFLKNTGMITYELFDILISWQVLIIYVGLFSIFSGRSWHGLIAVLIGGIFLLPTLDLIDRDWLHVYWPLILVFVGIFQLFKPKRKHNHDFRFDFNNEKNGQRSSIYSNSNYESNDGFVQINNTFGSIQQIVLDPAFKGADIKNTFGGTVLDLRRTKLEAAQTFIDIECVFGGIEIFLPQHWNVQSQVSTFLGGCDDKRYNSSVEIEHEHTLILRGNITFSGIELKS